MNYQKKILFTFKIVLGQSFFIYLPKTSLNSTFFDMLFREKVWINLSKTLPVKLVFFSNLKYLDSP